VAAWHALGKLGGLIMKFTKSQIQTVRYYLDHQHHPPTWYGFLRRIGWVLLMWAFVGAVGFYVCDAIGVPMIGWLGVGMMIGATIREARRHYHTTEVWPAIVAIVDWERAKKIGSEERGG
jgi:hypothetical protein